MNKHLKTLLLWLCLACGLAAQAQRENTYFPYPQVPEDLTSLSQRCNFLVDKFWERCNLKQSFSSLEKMNEAFGDWVSFMPYATADTIFPAIDRFIEDVAKTGGANLQTVVEMAENWVYSDSTDFYSEELYLPFCKAGAEHKKMPKKEKAKYAAQLRVLENSSLGKTVSPFAFTGADGSAASFGDVMASRVILLFMEADCFDCTLAKARLAADYNLNSLVKAGLVKMVVITPDEPTEEWKAEAATYPEGWIAAAMPDARELFDLSASPSIYYLNARHQVLGKHLSVDNMLLGLKQINQSMNR